MSVVRIAGSFAAIALALCASGKPDKDEKEIVCKTCNDTGRTEAQCPVCRGETDKEKLEFRLTTLFAGSQMTVFEKNGRRFAGDMKIKAVRLAQSIEFPSSPTVYPDIFEITAHDGVLNIKNISGSDIASDIFVYYKNIDENSDWYGGITYRTVAGGGLKKDELRQLPASHFKKESSKVVFVTYAN